MDGLEVRYNLRELAQIVKRDFSSIVRNLLFTHTAFIQETEKHPLKSVANVAQIGGIEFIAKCLRLLNRPIDLRRRPAQGLQRPKVLQCSGIDASSVCHEVEQLSRRLRFGVPNRLFMPATT